VAAPVMLRFACARRESHDGSPFGRALFNAQERVTRCWTHVFWKTRRQKKSPAEAGLSPQMAPLALGAFPNDALAGLAPAPVCPCRLCPAPYNFVSRSINEGRAIHKAAGEAGTCRSSRLSAWGVN
jgi:hypothetical protein